MIHIQHYHRTFWPDLLFAIFIIALSGIPKFMLAQHANDATWKIKQSSDFTITGDGRNENWKKAAWLVLPQRSSSELKLSTRLKALYSETGVYFLYSCQDKQLTAYIMEDFKDLWNEDVVEVFIWPDESSPVYFEYEISPLNYELAILVANDSGDIVRWQPFHYQEDRQTRHATAVQGGEKKSNAVISSWTAEFFIPYKLLRPLNNIQPKQGSKWRANFYRVDYDKNQNTSWSWQQTRGTFHDLVRFGTLLFE